MTPGKHNENTPESCLLLVLKDAQLNSLNNNVTCRNYKENKKANAGNFI